ncbi:MAG: hypothetical protein HQK49_18090 [Oligoflexia bacterium]|nr:hypothetical protein [Oligoflexia bacterium]
MIKISLKINACTSIKQLIRNAYKKFILFFNFFIVVWSALSLAITEIAYAQYGGYPSSYGYGSTAQYPGGMSGMMMGGGMAAPYGMAPMMMASGGGGMPYGGYQTNYLSGQGTSNTGGNLFGIPGVNSQSVMMGAGMALGTVSSTANTAIEMQKNTMLAQMMAKMGPTPPLQKQDDFFPECNTAVAQESHPTSDACAKEKTNTQEASMQALQIYARAETYKKNYELVTMKGGSTASNFGIKCIEESNKRLMDKLHQQRQSLTDLIGMANDSNEKMKSTLQTQQLAMSKLKNELDGKGGGPETRDDKRRDMRKYFDNDDCKNVMDVAGMESGKGFITVRDELKAQQTKSSNIIRDIKNGKIEQMLNDDIKKIQRKKKTDIGPLTALNFPMADKVHADQRSELEFKYKQVKDRIRAAIPEVELPENVTGLERGREVQNLPTLGYLKDQAKRKCMADKSQMIAPEDVLNLVVQMDDNNGIMDQSRSSTVKIFKTKLQAIFKRPNVLIQDQIREIQALESQYKGFRAPMSSLYKKEGTNQAWKVSEILKSKEQLCEDNFNFQPHKPGSSMTMKDIINQELAGLGDFQKELGKSDSSIVDTIKKRILNCEGVPPVRSHTDCQARTDSANENFCIGQAQTCADNLISCLKKADGLVKEREEKLDKMATQYNNQVKSIVNDQRKVIASVVSQVKASAQFLNKYFPGGKFNIAGGAGGAAPAGFNLQVNLPNMGNGKFGVDLLGDGDVNFMDKISSSISSLTQSMQQQEQQIQQQVTSRIAELDQRYKAEQQYWTGLADKCLQAVYGFAQMQNNMMMAQQQQQLRDYESMMRFCMQQQSLVINGNCQGQAREAMNAMSQVSMPGIAMTQEAQKVQYALNTCNMIAGGRIGENAPTTPDSLLTMGLTEINYIDLCLKKQIGATENLITNFASQITFRVKDNLKMQFPNGSWDDDILQSIRNAGDKNVVNGKVESVAGVKVNELEKTPTGKYITAMANLYVASKQKFRIANIKSEETRYKTLRVPVQDTNGNIIPDKYDEIPDTKNPTTITTTRPGIEKVPSGGGDGDGGLCEVVSSLYSKLNGDSNIRARCPQPVVYPGAPPQQVDITECMNKIISMDIASGVVEAPLNGTSTPGEKQKRTTIDIGTHMRTLALNFPLIKEEHNGNQNFALQSQASPMCSAMSMAGRPQVPPQMPGMPGAMGTQQFNSIAGGGAAGAFR